MLATLLADFAAFALMIAGVEGFHVVSPGANTIVSTSGIFFSLVVAWAYWIDKA